MTATSEDILPYSAGITATTDNISPRAANTHEMTAIPMQIDHFHTDLEARILDRPGFPERVKVAPKVERPGEPRGILDGVLGHAGPLGAC